MHPVVERISSEAFQALNIEPQISGMVLLRSPYGQSIRPELWLLLNKNLEYLFTF